MSNVDVFLAWERRCNADAGSEPVEQEIEDNGRHQGIKSYRRYEYNPGSVRAEALNNECKNCLYAQWELHDAVVVGDGWRLEPPCASGFYEGAKEFIVIPDSKPKLNKTWIVYLACFCEKKHRYVDHMPIRCGGNDEEEKEEMIRMAHEEAARERPAQRQEPRN